MSIQPGKTTTVIINPNKSGSSTLKNILKRYLFYWPLFLLCIGISAAVAVFYLNNARPLYVVKATLLIKDDKKTPDSKAEMLKEIGITNSTDGVENEMEILKSKKLINQVVRNLQLWITYKKTDGLFADDLYKKSPVKLLSFKPTGKLNNDEIDIVIKDNKTFWFKNPDGKLSEFAFNNSYMSRFGIWKLAPGKRIIGHKGDVIKIVLSDPEKITLSYQDIIDISLATKLATSVDLSVTDKVPERGRDVLNSLISNYTLYSAIEKSLETKRTLDFVDQRLASLTGELKASEKGIEGFKSSRGLTDLNSEAQIRLENQQVNDANLNEVNIKLSVVDGIEKYINSNQTSEKAPATVGITDPALSNSIEKLSQLQLQHDKLAATMPETNPDFDPINNQIKTTKAAIKENVKNIKISLQRTKEKLDTYNKGFEASIKNMPSEERQYISIKRQQSSKESLYTYLLQKKEEVSVKYASTLSNNRVIDEAYAESPRDLTPIVSFVTMLFGIGFPIGLISLRNSLNTRISKITDITDVLKLPVVGELPFEKNQNLVAINENNVSAVSEQIRALRIKLFFLHNERKTGRVTLLTSSIPGEGKSFVSVNLGIALAFAFKKTIILELDMRKPRVAQALGLSSEESGISEYLNGRAELSDIIRPAGSILNLDIIACGSIVNNPSELLEKKELEELIAVLRKDYDDIILDSPPVHLVPDAIILSRIADVTLYVIRQGTTDKAELEFINQLDEQKQLHNINIIFNGIERIKHGYGYKYDQRYYTTTRKSVLAPVFSNFKSRF
ncbi:tyrosine-protein kinase [Mucilaginibacter sp.]|uniref:GumC family protein n=1 Tax=Mucilaginibacter sp. TaxID=1882438 RepID=UPI00262F522C|nr:tyrosine-protein kinase [Mucilaginibacter sp.]MDB4919106.1 polysaccharide biosynthesis tyrosine autokinase [Mucilaginibacter sp.]